VPSNLHDHETANFFLGRLGELAPFAPHRLGFAAPHSQTSSSSS